MIKLSVTADTLAEAVEQLRKLLVELDAPVVEAAMNPPPKPRKKRVSKKKPAEPKPPEVLGEVAPVSIDEVRSALHAVARSHGQDAVKSLLGEHSAKKISELNESAYADVVKRAFGMHGNG